MKILNCVSEYPRKVALILGFFDGVHLGHREVIKKAIDNAKKNNTKTVLVTINLSPMEFFCNKAEYIFERSYSYSIIEDLGIDYLLELDFATVVKYSAKQYLENVLLNNFEPVSITIGFNHTFGYNKEGDFNFLNKYSNEYNYESICVEPYVYNKEIVSSTLIRNCLKNGFVEKANELLGSNFKLFSFVIEGEKIGRELGYPTANLKYPTGIVQLPYGVYKVKVNNNLAVLNWGVKPTVGSDKPILEAHLLDFAGNLYGESLEIEFLKKIRDEKKFETLDALKLQIKKDIEECLK